MDVSGEHSGDVINTSSTDNYDTDPDSDTLTVTAIRTGSVEGSGTAGSVGSALTGTYGDLTIAANGSYTYEVADNSTMDALDAGDIVTDTFNYTVSDGQGETDIATITMMAKQQIFLLKMIGLEDILGMLMVQNYLLLITKKEPTKKF